MIEPTTLARPYARAAFEHARAAGDLAAWQAALSELAAIAAEPKVAAATRIKLPRSAQQRSPVWRGMPHHQQWQTCWPSWLTTAASHCCPRWQCCLTSSSKR